MAVAHTLLHIIWAEGSWINYSINDLDDPHRPFNFLVYDSWDNIVDYNNKVISKVNSYFMDLKDRDLVKIV